MSHHDVPLDPGTTDLLAAAPRSAARAPSPRAGHHIAEEPYAGAGFVGFTLACVVLLLALAANPSRAVLLSAGVLCAAAAIVAYAVTRLVALPGLAHDAGAWFEPWAVRAVRA